MLALGSTTVAPWLPSWLRGGRHLTPAALRRHIERQFLYRGVSTLELRSLERDGDHLDVAFYARPIFPNDRRIQNRTRAVAFAEQLFQDAVTVLETIWRDAEDIETVNLSVWLKTVDGVGQTLPVLVTEATRAQAARIPAGGRLGPVDILRRFSTRVRIDRHGNLHEERELQ